MLRNAKSSLTLHHMPLHYFATFIDQEYGSSRTIRAAAEPAGGVGAAGAFGSLEGIFGRGVGDLPNRLHARLPWHPDELQGAIADIGPDIVWNRCVGRRGWRDAGPHSGWAFTAL